MSTLADYPPFKPGCPELAICACVLLDAPTVVPMLMAQKRITPEMFIHPLAQAWMNCVWWMTENNIDIDSWSLPNRMFDGKFIDDRMLIGDLIEHSLNNTPTSAHAGHYADRLIEDHVKRLMKLKLAATLREIEDGIPKPIEFAKELPARFMDLIPTSRRERTNAEVADEVIKVWEDIHAGIRPACLVQTGIPEIDAILLFIPGLHFIAGRPSAGKTSFEGTIRTHNSGRAVNPVPVAGLTLDMNHNAVIMRDLCRHAGVSAAMMNHGFGFASEFAKLKSARDEIAKWVMPIHDGDTLGDNIDAIITHIRMCKIRYNIAAFTIDYIQQIDMTGDNGHADEYRMLNKISKRLKRVGLELGIPIIVLCQLGRGADKSETGRPKMSDLKGTGNFEQDASSITFLYKEPKFDYNHAAVVASKIDEKKQRAVCIEIAKQQNGETGFLEFWFHAPYFKFELAPDKWGFPGMFEEQQQQAQQPARKQRRY